MTGHKIGARVELVLYSKQGNLTERRTRGLFRIITFFLRLFGIKFGAQAETVGIEIIGNAVKWTKL